MFKHIVKVGSYYYLCQLSWFGWEYYDHKGGNGYWWPILYIKNASRFNSEIELRNTLMVQKLKKPKPEFVGWF